MAQRFFFWSTLMALLLCVSAISQVSANDFFVGCRTRPTCGKVCKLVCETTKITAVCYGCECTEICIPSHSRRGCKHCESCYGEECCTLDPTTCGEECCTSNCECGGRGCLSCQDKGPECKFCWYDWFACGCAKPRTVKVLTKYEAEKEISWYHWEVVDACEYYEGEEAAEESSEEPSDETAANGPNPIAAPVAAQIYKPAPEEAQVGDVLPLSDSERAQLTSFLSSDVGGATQAVNRDAAPADEQVGPPATEAEGGKPSLMKKLSGFFGT
jgi:hypothetical protein